MSALLALLASLLWGAADFLGGTLSRRVHPLAVVGGSQAFGLLGAAAVAGVLADPASRGGWLLWPVVAGLAGMLGLGSFYAALATGTMGVVAPIAASGVVVPVSVGLARGDSPSGAQLAGIAVVVVGVMLASGPELRGRVGGRPVALAAIAALAFGVALVGVAEGGEHDAAMTVVVMRVTSVSVLALLALTLRRSGGARRRDLPVLAAVGAGDTMANGAFALASQGSMVSITAVLASLYPAVTVLLARGVHGERMRPVQDVGSVLALTGVVLIAAGGGTG